MSRSIAFTPQGWEDYTYWQRNDKRLLKKCNQLIRDCLRDPFQGIGKPEGLRGDLAGTWSRRITDEHRLVYIVSNSDITVLACRYHY